MAKFKSPKAKPAPVSAMRAVPCLIVVVGGLVLVGLLLFFSLQSGS